MPVLEPLITRLIDQYSWTLIPILLFVFVVVFYDRLLRIGRDIGGLCVRCKVAIIQIRCPHYVRDDMELGDTIELAWLYPTVYALEEPGVGCSKCDKWFATSKYESDLYKEGQKIAGKEGWDEVKRVEIYGTIVDSINLTRRSKSDT